MVLCIENKALLDPPNQNDPCSNGFKCSCWASFPRTIYNTSRFRFIHYEAKTFFSRCKSLLKASLLRRSIQIIFPNAVSCSFLLFKPLKKLIAANLHFVFLRFKKKQLSIFPIIILDYNIILLHREERLSICWNESIK